jgi:hypothetical protein
VGVEWCVHARVAAHRSWCWGVELRGLWWGFYRLEERVVAWARATGEDPTRGQNRGAPTLLAPVGLAVALAVSAVEECRRVEAS